MMNKRERFIEDWIYELRSIFIKKIEIILDKNNVRMSGSLNIITLHTSLDIIKFSVYKPFDFFDVSEAALKLILEDELNIKGLKYDDSLWYTIKTNNRNLKELIYMRAVYFALLKFIR